MTTLAHEEQLLTAWAEQLADDRVVGHLERHRRQLARRVLAVLGIDERDHAGTRSSSGRIHDGPPSFGIFVRSATVNFGKFHSKNHSAITQSSER